MATGPWVPCEVHSWAPATSPVSAVSNVVVTRSNVLLFAMILALSSSIC